MKKGWVYAFVFTVVIASIILVSSINLDLNHDGVVNITDLQILAAHFEGKATYNSSFDVNGNGKVDLYDVVSVAKDIGANTNSGNGSNVSSNRTVLFHSDWSTATGTSSAALLDTSKSHPWGSYLANSPVMEVVNASEGNPFAPYGMKNALKVQVNGAASATRIWPGSNGLTDPGLNVPIYIRSYVYIDTPNDETHDGHGANHPQEQRDASDNIPWAWCWGENSSDTVSLIMYFNDQNGQNTPGAFKYFDGPTLKKRTVYRIETKITRIASQRFTVDAKVYLGNSTTPIFTAADFNTGGGSYTGSGTMATDGNGVGGNGIYSGSNAALLGLTAGTNGPIDGGTGWFANNPVPAYYYWGGICVQTGTWCGPYSNGI